MIVSLHEFICNSLLAIGGITAKAKVLLHPFNISHFTTSLNFLLLSFPGRVLVPIALAASKLSDLPLFISLLIIEVLPIFIFIISPGRQLVIAVLPVGNLVLGFQISLNRLGNQLLSVLLAVLPLLVEESSLFKFFLIKLLLVLSKCFTVSFTQKDWF